MHDDTAAHPSGVVDELLDAARAADGGLNKQETAEILNTPESGVDVLVTRERSKTDATDTRD